MKRKPKRIRVVIVKWRHRANGLYLRYNFSYDFSWIFSFAKEGCRECEVYNLLEFISVDVGGGGVIVVINILYCLLVCIFFTHFLSLFFAVSSYFWQLASAYSRISSTFALSSPWLMLRTLRSKDAMKTKTSVKKWICALSVFITIIPTHLLCQI